MSKRLLNTLNRRMWRELSLRPAVLRELFKRLTKERKRRAMQ